MKTPRSKIEIVGTRQLTWILLTNVSSKGIGSWYVILKGSTRKRKVRKEKNIFFVKRKVKRKIIKNSKTEKYLPKDSFAKKDRTAKTKIKMRTIPISFFLKNFFNIKLFYHVNTYLIGVITICLSIPSPTLSVEISLNFISAR